MALNRTICIYCFVGPICENELHLKCLIGSWQFQSRVISFISNSKPIRCTTGYAYMDTCIHISMTPAQREILQFRANSKFLYGLLSCGLHRKSCLRLNRIVHIYIYIYFNVLASVSDWLKRVSCRCHNVGSSVKFNYRIVEFGWRR